MHLGTLVAAKGTIWNFFPSNLLFHNISVGRYLYVVQSRLRSDLFSWGSILLLFMHSCHVVCKQYSSKTMILHPLFNKLFKKHPKMPPPSRSHHCVTVSRLIEVLKAKIKFHLSLGGFSFLSKYTFQDSHGNWHSQPQLPLPATLLSPKKC